MTGTGLSWACYVQGCRGRAGRGAATREHVGHVAASVHVHGTCWDAPGLPLPSASAALQRPTPSALPPNPCAGLDMAPGDIAFKSNFATLDPASGIVLRRRADRRFEDLGPVLCAALDGMRLPSFPQVPGRRSSCGVGVAHMRLGARGLPRHLRRSAPSCQRCSAAAQAPDLCLITSLPSPLHLLLAALLHCYATCCCFHLTASLPSCFCLQHTVSVKYATEHRCGVVVRGTGLNDAIGGTDPLKDNLPLLVCVLEGDARGLGASCDGGAAQACASCASRGRAAALGCPAAQPGSPISSTSPPHHLLLLAARRAAGRLPPGGTHSGGCERSVGLHPPSAGGARCECAARRRGQAARQRGAAARLRLPPGAAGVKGFGGGASKTERGDGAAADGKPTLLWCCCVAAAAAWVPTWGPPAHIEEEVSQAQVARDRPTQGLLHARAPSPAAALPCPPPPPPPACAGISRAARPARLHGGTHQNHCRSVCAAHCGVLGRPAAAGAAP